MTSPSITTFLSYDTEAEEAAKLYTSVFGGTIKETLHSPAGAPGALGSVLTVTFELLGQTYIALNGGPSFTFTNAVSLMVQVDTQEELDHFWSKLLDAGSKPVACGWITDRFGVSWQIAPRPLLAMLSDPDRDAASRAMTEMRTMVKLDLPKLQAAFERAD